MTTSPGWASPSPTRHTPTARTARTPRLGSPSSNGSNAARMRPTWMPSSRSALALRPNRSVSSASRPSVLTTIAPSKDSWAISLSSARSAWMRVKIGEENRWKTTLAIITSGKTSSPTSAITRSVEQHLEDGDHHHREGADRHRQRRDRREGRLDVGVGVGQQLPGGVPLVPGHRQVEVLAGDLAPVGGLHAVLHHAGAETPGDDADGTQDRDPEEQRQDRHEGPGGGGAALEGGQHHVVGGPAQHPGVRDRQGAEEDAAERSRA